MLAKNRLLLGVVQDHSAYPDHFEFLAKAIDWDFNWVEFKYENILDPEKKLLAEKGLELGKLADENKIKVSLHASYDESQDISNAINFGSKDKLIQKSSKNNFLFCLKFAENINAEFITLHGGFMRLVDVNPDISFLLRNLISEEEFIKFKKRFLKNLKWAVAEAKKRGITIALENFFASPPKRRKVKFPVTAADILECLEFIGPDLKIMFDLGHSNSNFNPDSLSPVGFIDKIGVNNIIGSHLHDNHGNWDEHLVLGEGEIDYPAFVKRYFKYNYFFPLNLEMQDNRDLIDSNYLQSKEYINKLI